MYQTQRMQPIQANPQQSVPEHRSALRNRRRTVRQKAHSPAFVSMDSNPAGTSVDLNPIVDISEDGMSFCASRRMEAGQDFDLRLDVAETNRSIAATAQVVWSEPSGLTGVRFREMPNSSLLQLKEWLFLNAICACARHTAEQAREANLESLEEQFEEPAIPPTPAPDELGIPSQTEYAEVLSAMAFVKLEVESAGPDLDRILQVLPDRARALTHASGAAVAIIDGEEMTCCATVGPDAPPRRARFQVGSGFSGECVRSGRMLHCDDSETDPHVDRESCRALGIRSILAMPVHIGDRVIGLLELFSPQPAVFGAREKIVLRRMAGIMVAAILPAAVSVAEEPGLTAASPSPAVEQSVLGFEKTGFEESGSGEIPAEPALETPQRSRFLRPGWILTGCAVALLVAVGALLVPRIIRRRSGSIVPASLAAASRKDAPKPHAGLGPPESDLQRLRRLAEQGDAAAQYSLGSRYALGEDVKQDYTVAAHWFSLAAEQGHVTAQATLGAYYDLGRGVPQDSAKAYFWCVLALAGGDEASKYRLPALASNLSRSQIIAAQEEANDWLSQHQSASKNSPGSQP